MYCANCGEEITERASYCRCCGAEIRKAARPAAEQTKGEAAGKSEVDVVSLVAIILVICLAAGLVWGILHYMAAAAAARAFTGYFGRVYNSIKSFL